MELRIPEFSNARVLVVGDLMLDRYWHGGTSRISPEAPVPVVHVKQVEERPGGAGNVALNLATLGGSAAVIALTGQDEAAQVLRDRLTAAGVDCLFQMLPDRPTVTKLRILSRHQQLIRLDFEESFEGYDTQAMLADYDNQLQQVGAVVLSDYGKGGLQPLEQLIERGRAAGRPVLVDPKSKDFGIYRGASLITPNLSEFEAAVGSVRDEQELVDKGLALIERCELEALLITRGDQGMTLLQPGEPEHHMPTHAREVFDVTGAGDTVISVLAAALAAGEDLAHATALSNLAAGIVVGKLGTAAVSVPELRRALHDHQHSGTGVMSEDQLMIAVEDARHHGERIVFTNGCFDILHAGHVAYLEEAKAQGDRLIVAVNDDDSVRRLKGKGRPINPVDRRMAVLAGLASVDWVVPFSEDTPERLICRVLPDCLVKGGDYRPQDIAGYDCVTGNGGQVKVVSFAEGLSTSNLIETIRNGQ